MGYTLPKASLAEYYKPLTKGLPVDVRTAGAKGKGMFAQRAFSPGEIVYMEKPLLTFQHGPNKEQVVACAECAAMLGDAAMQAAHLLSPVLRECNVRRRPVQLSMPCLRELTLNGRACCCPSCSPAAEVVACEAGCGAVYCSLKCRARAYEGHHRLLCPGSPDAQRTDPHRRALALFEAHAHSTHESFIMVAKIIARALIQASEAEADADESSATPEAAAGAGAETGVGAAKCDAECQGDGDTSTASSCKSTREGADAVAQALRPFLQFVTFSWWDLVVTGVPEAKRDLHLQTASEILQESLQLLRLGLKPHLKGTAELLLQPPCYSALLGMLEVNNISLDVVSPINRYMVQVDQLPPRERGPVVQRLRPLIELAQHLHDVQYPPVYMEWDVVETAGAGAGCNSGTGKPERHAGGDRSTGKNGDPESCPAADADGPSDADSNIQPPLGTPSSASATPDTATSISSTSLHSSSTPIHFESDIFPSFQGAALFALVASMNHSCEPNVVVHYDRDHTARVKCVRPVQEGEELCNSYVNEALEWALRQAKLWDYQFQCECPKCRAQRPDIASGGTHVEEDRKRGGEQDNGEKGAKRLKKVTASCHSF